jgi:hypothetical protein
MSDRLDGVICTLQDLELAKGPTLHCLTRVETIGLVVSTPPSWLTLHNADVAIVAGRDGCRIFACCASGFCAHHRARIQITLQSGIYCPVFRGMSYVNGKRAQEED